MTQKVLLKVYVGKGEKITFDKAESYKQTAKLLKDIVFNCDRYGDRYPNKQVRIEDMMKFNVGFSSSPSSGCVYCFEEDLEEAKKILVEVINKRVQGMLNRFKFDVEEHNRQTVNAEGVHRIKLEWEIL